MGETLHVQTTSAEGTRDLGAAIGAIAQVGDVILLLGSFGVGKTTLVQGIARGLGVADVVTSPSFVIANEYQGRMPLYHVDLYRVEQMDQVTLEALAEYFGGDGLCVVEWPEPVPIELVHNATRIKLEVNGETTRLLSIESDAPRSLREIFESCSAERAPARDARRPS